MKLLLTLKCITTLIKTEFKGYPQKRYLPLEKADLTVLKASEKDVIDKVIEQMSDWSATAISDYSHKDLPWEVTEEGKDISYNLAFYRELPYSVRVYDEEDEQKEDHVDHGSHLHVHCWLVAFASSHGRWSKGFSRSLNPPSAPSPLPILPLPLPVNPKIL